MARIQSNTLNVMKRIRINNDIRIQWNINQKGGDIDLTSFDSKVTLIDPNNRPCKIDVTVKEDYILATFHAADQHVLGLHILTLTLNLGEKSRITTDTYAFALVARTDEETDDTEESPVETETAQLESEVFLDTAVLIQQFEEVKVEVEELEEKVQRQEESTTTLSDNLSALSEKVSAVEQKVKNLETTTLVDTTTRRTDFALSNTNVVLARTGLSAISKPIAIPANTTFKLSDLGSSRVLICTPTTIKLGKDLTPYIMTTITAATNPQSIRYNKDIMLIERGDSVGSLTVTIADDASALWGLVDAQVNLAMLDINERLSTIENSI